jgi:hypothetical protein
MGLFPHYQADPASVYQAAAETEAKAKPIASLRGAVKSQHAQAAASTSGVLVPPLTAALDPVVKAAETVLQDAAFAAGCTRYWGDAITTYNAGVDGLNQRYDEAAANNFGQTAPSLWDYLGSGKLDEYADDLNAYQAHVAAARDALIAQLQREEQLLDATLDDEATQFADWLAKGADDASVLALVRAGAMSLSVVDIFPAIDFSSIDMAALRRQLVAQGRSGFLDPTQFPTAESAKLLLDLLREDGVPPSDYAQLLQRYWLLTATEKAGIYLDGWDPTAGSDANMGNLVASYDYYGKLFLDNPDFQWAGMASMIGPTFAGGMFDLQLLKQLGDIASTPLDVAPDWLVTPLMPPVLRDLAVLGQLSEEEFRFFETSLLQMQKAIFSDQMPMHEAYLAGGITNIKEMYDAGLIDTNTYQAWQGINSGDPGRVADGNEQLLYREQHDIIRQAYDDMRNYHGPVGQAMTYAMGTIGAPGIPGAQTLGQYDPLAFSGTVEAPGIDTGGWDGPGPFDLPSIHTPRPYGTLEVTTPLPAGNISDFDTRWELIENDTLPAYQKLLAEHPEEVRAMLTASVQDRIDDARIATNIDDILARLADWDVRVELGVR